MSGIWGNNIRLALFGESHGAAIGITIDGLPPGLELDLDKIRQEMTRRAPGNNPLSTSRKEADIPEILSGFFNGRTTGTPLCAIIRNQDMHSEDYNRLKDVMRPGHADYTGNIHYHGFNDFRGGGHFSGRLTAPLVFCGAICKQMLALVGIHIGAHIKQIGSVLDESFDPVNLNQETLKRLQQEEFPLLNSEKRQAMTDVIFQAKSQGDSVGGIIECAVLGAQAGIGEPFFDSVESTLSHLLFSIPGIKGVEFGLGFEMASLLGSECNDEFFYDRDAVRTRTNHSGGILGGITSGMPILFKAAMRPTASISKQQQTVSLADRKNVPLVVTGRHDPCIVPRAVVVVEAAAAIGMADLLKGREEWKI